MENTKDVRDVLSDELLHRVVRLKNVQTDKYGRILADVYLVTYQSMVS